MQVATALRSDFADGLCFIDLARIDAGGLVSDAVAAALGVRQSADRSMSDTLCFSLQRRRLLLIVDCCERMIVEAAALAVAILRSCANVHIVTTTREALKIAGEHVYNIPALDVPSREERLNAAAALEFGAIALFVDRARATDRSFCFDDASVGLVVDICRQVDGIALAIELAAARVKTPGLIILARRLDKRLSLLTGARTSPPRHQTMRASP
jgi:predicted ATPase